MSQSQEFDDDDRWEITRGGFEQQSPVATLLDVKATTGAEPSVRVQMYTSRQDEIFSSHRSQIVKLLRGSLGVDWVKESNDICEGLQVVVREDSNAQVSFGTCRPRAQTSDGPTPRQLLVWGLDRIPDRAVVMQDLATSKLLRM